MFHPSIVMCGGTTSSASNCHVRRRTARRGGAIVVCVQWQRPLLTNLTQTSQIRSLSFYPSAIAVGGSPLCDLGLCDVWSDYESQAGDGTVAACSLFMLVKQIYFRRRCFCTQARTQKRKLSETCIQHLMHLKQWDCGMSEGATIVCVVTTVSLRVCAVDD